jgi:hypothetical protein
MRLNTAIAVLAGLVLRLYFVLKFPATGTGDGPFYIELASNWLKNHVYGAMVDGKLVPIDTRVPGYPALLAAVFAVVGNSQRAVMLAQVLVDLATCAVIAMIAARVAPERARSRVTPAGLWLAALCPFTANYTAITLTETLVTFLTALGLLVLLQAAALEFAPANDLGAGTVPVGVNPWFLAGIVGGLGALVRPETPLTLAAAGIVLVALWWRPKDWTKLVRVGVLMGVGVILPLVPWAARNWRTLHQVQFLAPRYANLPSEIVPHGVNAWTGTWLWRFRDVYLTLWKFDDEAVPIETIPPSAFDSAAERNRVAAILAVYNDSTTLTPEIDGAFGEIARERTARHPLRTYIEIPFLRCVSMWFTPRVELLPYSGQIFPLRSEWHDDRRDLVVSVTLFGIDIIYVALALVGAWIARKSPGWAMLIVFVVVRTVFFATMVETPEPRYVLECFPAVIALAAQVFAGRAQLSSTGSG